MSTIDKDTTTEKEIDLIELGKKLWKKRLFIIKISLVGLVAGVIIAFSIPKEYKTTVVLAPEATSSGGSSGGMGALAAMAGINLQRNSPDAISPDLYPNIVSSTPFNIGLFNVKVEDAEKDINTDLYTYLDQKQKAAWWSYIFSAPSKLLGLFSSKKEGVSNDSINLDRIQLSMEQERILSNLQSRVGVSVDKKTGVITLSVMMQNPRISAYLADTVTSYLQEYIIKYRTQKARQDLQFTEKLHEEAKSDYYKAQQNYAIFSDGNLDIISARYGTTKERLQNEMSLAYAVYNQMAQQLQMAKVKVQDITPVYTVIQPSVIPLIPEKPNKKLIAIGFIFVAFAGACFWTLIRDYLSSSSSINN